MAATATQFVGADVPTGALVLAVAAVMLVLSDSLVLSRSVFNLVCAPPLSFDAIYRPLHPRLAPAKAEAERADSKQFVAMVPAAVSAQSVPTASARTRDLDV